jgi:adenosine kinase
VQPVPQLLLTGSIAVDRIATFNGDYLHHINPANLQSLSVSIFLDHLRDTRGGVAANIAYTLALLGEHPILIGSVGPESAKYMNDLRAMGINTDHVHTSSLPTASFTVIGDSEGHQVGGFYPGAMFDSDSLSLAHWKHKDPFVVISPHDPKAMHRQVAACKKDGLRLFYDIGQQANNIDGEDIKLGIEAAELIIVNDFELEVISRKTGLSPAHLKKTVPVIVTTLGAKGSVIEGARVPQPVHIGIAKPAEIADSTGAGDAYRSGFLYAYIRGADLKVCAQLGAVCAAYALEHIGTQEHLFSKSELAARYKLSFNEPIPEQLAIK